MSLSRFTSNHNSERPPTTTNGHQDTQCKSCILFNFFHQNNQIIRWRLIMYTSYSLAIIQYPPPSITTKDSSVTPPKYLLIRSTNVMEAYSVLLPTIIYNLAHTHIRNMYSHTQNPKHITHIPNTTLIIIIVHLRHDTLLFLIQYYINISISHTTIRRNSKL